ncbi:MAG: tRNA 2-thiouridine(34) synthase MnmA [Candidatus Neomarinimicrobiota bacterium]|jgi:tRNA-specific 2-thiouridylase|nr:tRNA 2-thiouridine(34) synthase MnmA [Candidatus Neomarinimicrobiota bacterium]MDD3966919.1 tRNA 2-thiouridine(34) synthase MnmA [Candidatus Neomarinimicrobiota bacterium]MDX9779827.1 tRNA 2-thiouridine(34) synthase MnmA [bacterium]
MGRKRKILVGMSGGVDSSIAVHLLQKADYNVTGVTFRLADRYLAGSAKQLHVAERAARVCQQFGIEHIVADHSADFDSCVVRYFADAYFKGFTPNPCVQCNRELKWRAMGRLADELGIPFIATGHYARIKDRREKHLLLKGKDALKDQSYFLWRLSPDDLARTVFPLGELQKSEVVRIAEELGLEQARQPESQDVCFIPEEDYKTFLEKHFAERVHAVGEGDFIDMQGRVIGRHGGFYRFTVGQRKGLGIAQGEPVYVRAIYPESNTVQVGTRMESEDLGCVVTDCNWISVPAPQENLECTAKVRYRNKGVAARIEPLGSGKFHLFFREPVHAVTPGQSAVFYDKDVLIGGGIIQPNGQKG